MKQGIGFKFPIFASPKAMKALLRTIICLLFLSGTAFGQAWKYYRHEVRIGIGASNFLGELGGANAIGTNGVKDLEFSLTRPTGEIIYAYKLIPNLKLRSHLLFGRLKGDDALTQERYRNNRNLSFRSPIVELAVGMEFYPFKEKTTHMYRMRGAKGSNIKMMSPYFFGGVAAFWFNPKAQYPVDGKYYALYALNTEGQGLPGGPADYKRLGFCLPVGAGIKYALNKHISIGFEISGRITFTDYIDDVSTVYYDNTAILNANGAVAAYFADPSLHDPQTIALSGGDPTRPGLQRGDDLDNDSYLFAIFSINYRFLKGRFVLPKF